jgi:hypothetical protein
LSASWLFSLYVFSIASEHEFVADDFHRFFSFNPSLTWIPTLKIGRLLVLILRKRAGAAFLRFRAAKNNSILGSCRICGGAFSVFLGRKRIHGAERPLRRRVRCDWEAKMYRLPVRPTDDQDREFPMSMLAVGHADHSFDPPACPYRGCSSQLRWAPLGGHEQGLVCENHGVIWKSKIDFR